MKANLNGVEPSVLRSLTVRKNTLYELASLVDTPATVKRIFGGLGGFRTEPFNVT